MKKLFKKLKEKLSSKQNKQKSNDELSEAYHPDDFDEQTGEYDLSNADFNEATGQYRLEENEEEEEEEEELQNQEQELDSAYEENLESNALELSDDQDGETLADLLKRARESDSEEILAEESEEIYESFEVEELAVSDVKEKHQLANEDLPDFPAAPPEDSPVPDLPSIDMDLPDAPLETLPSDTPESFESEQLFSSNSTVDDEGFRPDLPDDVIGDLSDPQQTEELPDIEPEIQNEFNQDLRDYLTAETELPSPENTNSKFDHKGLLGKLKKTNTYLNLLKFSKNGINQSKLQDGFTRFFARENRPNIHRAFIWSMALGSSAMLGKIIGNALVVTSSSKGITKTPPSTKMMKNRKQELLIFYESDLFKTAEHELDKSNQGAEKPKPKKKKILDLTSVCDLNSTKTKSDSAYTLTHTVVLQDSVKSIAAVSIRGNKTPLTLREGDKIDGKSRIDHIYYQKLILKNLESGECEYLAALDDKKKTKTAKAPYKILPPNQGKKLLENKDVNDNIKNDGNKYSIKKEERTKLLSNLDDLLTQALAIQIKNPDGSLSFKLTEIVPGSFYTKIGIQNGDIIKLINGKPITNMNQVMGLFGKISEIDQFQLGVLRDGNLMNKEYNFE